MIHLNKARGLICIYNLLYWYCRADWCALYYAAFTPFNKESCQMGSSEPLYKLKDLPRTVPSRQEPFRNECVNGSACVSLVLKTGAQRMCPTGCFSTSYVYSSSCRAGILSHSSAHSATGSGTFRNDWATIIRESEEAPGSLFLRKPSWNFFSEDHCRNIQNC